MSPIKRITNELRKYNESQDMYICEIIFKNNEYQILVYSKNIHPNDISLLYCNDINILTLLVPESYPFKPYKIVNYQRPYSNEKINNHNNYLKFISTYNKIPFFICWFLTIKYRKHKFTTLNKVDCFCCASLTCPHNWSPNLTINNLINEYIDARIINFYSSKLMSRRLKYLFSYFDKINDDNLNMILDYCLE